MLKSVLDVYHDDEHKEYRDKLDYAEYNMDYMSSIIDSINLFVYDGLIGTDREYVLDNFRYKPEDRYRFDNVTDHSLLGLLIHHIKKDIAIHEKYITLENHCLPIDIKLSYEIVDKYKKLLQDVTIDSHV